MKKQITVVGAVVVKDGRVLAAQRSRQMSLPGLWEFPGGKIESGESPQQSLIREMREELLCEVAIGDQVEQTTYEYDFGIVTLTTFWATLVDAEPQLTEHSAVRWLAPSELDQVEWAPADIPAVQRVGEVLS